MAAVRKTVCLMTAVMVAAVSAAAPGNPAGTPASPTGAATPSPAGGAPPGAASKSADAPAPKAEPAPDPDRGVVLSLSGGRRTALLLLPPDRQPGAKVPLVVWLGPAIEVTPAHAPSAPAGGTGATAEARPVVEPGDALARRLWPALKKAGAGLLVPHFGSGGPTDEDAAVVRSAVDEAVAGGADAGRVAVVGCGAGGQALARWWTRADAGLGPAVRVRAAVLINAVPVRGARDLSPSLPVAGAAGGGLPSVLFAMGDSDPGVRLARAAQEQIAAAGGSAAVQVVADAGATDHEAVTDAVAGWIVPALDGRAPGAAALRLTEGQRLVRRRMLESVAAKLGGPALPAEAVPAAPPAKPAAAADGKASPSDARSVPKPQPPALGPVWADAGNGVSLQAPVGWVTRERYDGEIAGWTDGRAGGRSAVLVVRTAEDPGGAKSLAESRTAENAGAGVRHEFLGALPAKVGDVEGLLSLERVRLLRAESAGGVRRRILDVPAMVWTLWLPPVPAPAGSPAATGKWVRAGLVLPEPDDEAALPDTASTVVRILGAVRRTRG